MTTVSDTTTVNYLAIIGHSDVLPRLFGRVVVPPQVIAELRDPATPAAVHAWLDSQPTWLEVRAPKQPRPLTLDAGETEAIALAAETSKTVLLTDDRDAWRAAHRLGIPTMRTLDVLAKAADHGLLDLEDALARLKKTTFRAKSAHYQQVVQRHQDRQRTLSHQQGQPSPDLELLLATPDGGRLRAEVCRQDGAELVRLERVYRTRGGDRSSQQFRPQDLDDLQTLVQQTASELSQRRHLQPSLQPGQEQQPDPHSRGRKR